jgi:hypothetical protein
LHSRLSCGLATNWVLLSLPPQGGASITYLWSDFHYLFCWRLSVWSTELIVNPRNSISCVGSRILFLGLWWTPDSLT